MIRIYIFLFFLISCAGSKNENDESNSSKMGLISSENDLVQTSELLEQKSSNKFGFRFNLKNPDMLGFELQVADQAVGPKDILLVDDHAYITDLFHCNVKKVDVRTGEIVKTSKKLLDFASELYVARLNEYILVMSDRENVIFLDKELNLIKECPISDYRWKKEVIGVFENSFTCIRPLADVQQLDNLDIWVRQLKMFEDCSMEMDTFIVKIEDFEDFITNIDHIRGKKYSVIESGNAYLFQTEKATFRLNEKIPDTFKYLEAQNLDFDDNRIAYFELSKDSLFLKIINF